MGEARLGQMAGGIGFAAVGRVGQVVTAIDDHNVQILRARFQFAGADEGLVGHAALLS
jgi:hypothetical protein